MEVSNQNNSKSSENKCFDRLDSIDLINTLDLKFEDCPDIMKKRVYIDNIEAYFFFVKGLVNIDLIQRDFIKPVLDMSFENLCDEKQVHNLPGSICIVNDLDTLISNILSGETAFVCTKIPFTVTCELQKFQKRNVEAPIVEKNLRGPHEGFVESLLTNIAVIRRKTRNERLKFVNIKVGETTNQTACICYIKGLANTQIVDQLYAKIKAINFDGLLAIGYLEQAIIQFPNSIFPQYQVTERPDKAVAGLLEGRIIVMLDGTPVALIAPVNFFSFFQTLDDYSTYWIHGTFLRAIRMIALVVAVLLPAIYISITSFHYYAIPLDLLVTLAESRDKVPYPPVIEVLILEFAIELVREAAIRLPTYIGAAISIFAGLVIGQAAVEVGVVSNLLIIIVAITAVASYVIPSYDMSFAIRILKFIFIIFATLLGFIGIVICFCLVLAHLVTLDSLGQPYFQPLAPLKVKDLKDVFFRAPLQFLFRRPSNAKPQDYKRGKNNE